MSIDSTRRQRYTRRGALALIGGGGMILASETVAFTSLTADRGVDISVAGDDAASFAITGDGGGRGSAVDGGPTLDENPFATPLTIAFANDTDSDIPSTDGLAVTIEVTTAPEGITVDDSDFEEDTNGTLAESESETFLTGLATSQERVLHVDNDDEGENASDAEINVHVDADFDGITLDLDRASISIEPVQGTADIVNFSTLNDEVTVDMSEFRGLDTDTGGALTVTNTTTGDSVNANDVGEGEEVVNLAIESDDEVTAELYETTDRTVLLDSDTQQVGTLD